MEKIRVLFCSRSGNAGAAHRLGLRTANFLRQICNGQLDIEALGVALPEEHWGVDVSAPRYGVSAMRDTWSRLKDEPELLPEGVDLPDWPDGPTHWHMFGGWFRGQAGQANLGGNIARTNANAGSETAGHEQMHNRPFSLRHSNVYTEEGEKDEYGDRTGKMGSGAPMSQHVPHHYASGFLGGENEITKVTRNCAIQIAPWEVPERVRFDDEFTVVRVGDIVFPGINHSRIYVSTRKTKGYPWRFNRRPVDDRKVWVHAGTSTESFLLDVLDVGETTTRVPGVTITYEQEVEGEEAAIVRFEFDGDNTPIKSMQEEHDVLPPQPGVAPEEGLYYNHFMRGQGIDLRKFGDKYVMFWYTFDDYGNRDWFIAESDDITQPSTLYTVEGARFKDPSAGTRVELGVVRVVEHDGTVHLDYNTEVHGRGSVPMERLGKGDDGRMVMYDPSRDGEGITLTTYGKRIVGHWYTHEPRSTSRMWFYLDGGLEDDGTYAVTVYRARGNFIRHNVGENDYLVQTAVASLRPTGDGTAVFEVSEGEYECYLNLKEIP